MAIGDIYTDLQTVTSGNYLDIQPASGYEAVVHNIYYADDVELYRTDGSNNILVDSGTGSGMFNNLAIHVSNVQYVKVKNTTAASKYVGYDGIYTKTA
jgi:hypothetical protein